MVPELFSFSDILELLCKRIKEMSSAVRFHRELFRSPHNTVLCWPWAPASHWSQVRTAAFLAVFYAGTAFSLRVSDTWAKSVSCFAFLTIPMFKHQFSNINAIDMLENWTLYGGIRSTCPLGISPHWIFTCTFDKFSEPTMCTALGIQHWTRKVSPTWLLYIPVGIQTVCKYTNKCEKCYPESAKC